MTAVGRARHHPALALLLRLAVLLAHGTRHGSAYHDEFRLSAYVDIAHGPWFPEYKMGNVDFARVSQRASDLILYSIEPSSDGSVVVVEHLPPEVMAAARLAREHHPGVRLHVCVGGLSTKSSAFGAVVINLGLRRKLVAALMELVVEEDLDGIDFAWDEGPVNGDLDSGYGQLVSELKAAAVKDKEFTKPKLFVTLMVKPGASHPKAFAAADYIHLMSYDNCTAVPCQHSTFENAQVCLHLHTQTRAHALTRCHCLLWPARCLP